MEQILPDRLRKPLFIVAAILIVLVVLVEIATTAWLDFGTPETSRQAALLNASTPGYGIPSLALLDGLVAYVVLLMGLALLLPESIHGRMQGIATLLVSFLLLLVTIFTAGKALVVLTLMVTLLLATPFGTLAYLALYADFNTDGARITLSLLMGLKLFFAGFLVFAHQRFLQNKGLVLIVLTSLLANIIISFLHGIVPGFLVSITDAVAALLIAILAAIWAMFFLIGAIFSVLKVLF